MLHQVIFNCPALPRNVERNILQFESYNVGKKSHLTSSNLIRELLKKLPEYLRLQCLVQIRLDDVNEQNDVISKVEIGNEIRPKKRPTEVKNGESNKNYNLKEVSNNNKTYPIFRFGDHKPMQCDKVCRTDNKSR
jgi:hypothetical protein